MKNGQKRTADSLEKFEKKYLSGEDWAVKENANEMQSYGNFLRYLLEKILKRPDNLEKVFPEEAVKHHLQGSIHIHKLPDSFYVPYCAGWSFANILKVGLKTPTLVSKPAKHFDSAVNHLVNFVFLTAQEWSGAMATSGFDIYSAPLAAKDKSGEKQIKQVLQNMLYELNYPSRTGFQSPFSNITIALDTMESFLERDAIVGGKKDGVLGDYLEEAILIAKQLINLYDEGDAFGSPFTFPIPTLTLTKNFDWNDRKWDGLTNLIFSNLSKRGSFYLLNGYSANVEALYAMCCRLTIDISRIKRNAAFSAGNEVELKEFLGRKSHARGIWAIPDATGSVGVITINLPRIAFLSNGTEKKLFELLREEMEIAKKALDRMRNRYDRSLRNGLLPMTEIYLGSLTNHFSTFGLVGLPEAAANFFGGSNLWKELNKNDVAESVTWMKKVVKFVRECADEYSSREDILYNVEEVPAESTAYRLAVSDLQEFGRQVAKGSFFIPMGSDIPFYSTRIADAPFYSNSIIPYYAQLPIPERVKWEGEVQEEFTGGVMMHLFLYESPDPKALKNLVHRIVTNTKIVYFSITPTLAVCKKCGWNAIGIFGECPNCENRELEIWSRVVGYYRPMRSWNIGKIAEFLNRVEYGRSNKTLLAKRVLGYVL